MNSLLALIIQIINLYQLVLIIYIIGTWLINFNIINTSNRFVYSVMESMYRLCEPSLKLVRKFIPNFGNIDIVLSSPGAQVSAEFSPKATAAGAVVIDNNGVYELLDNN